MGGKHLFHRLRGLSGGLAAQQCRTAGATPGADVSQAHSGAVTRMAPWGKHWTIADVARLTGKPAAQIAAELAATPEPTTGSHRVGGRYVQRGTAGKRAALGG